MGDAAVSGIIQKQFNSDLQQSGKNVSQQTTGGGRSFENILQNGGNQANTPTENSITSDKKLDGMRLDLIERYNNLPDGAPKVSAVFPEYLNTKTNMSAFKNILNEALNSGLNKNQSKDVLGKFTNVEKEVGELDALMRSDKNLSQGELLGLQARLYQVSQHIDVLSKVVDQMTGGVKTILNTNV
jgi:hypothetical protein